MTMSTPSEKIRAQKMAFEHKPVQPWHRHLVGPEALEMLISDIPPGPAGWQPIATAPKNSQPVDLWHPSYGRLANYKRVSVSNSSNIFYDPVGDGVCTVRDATHWMPIPEPPKELTLQEHGPVEWD
jgi:hypothetical protein